MSTSMLFGAGAIVTFITLWGVLMAGGLFATRRQASDDGAEVPVAAPTLLTAPDVLAVEHSSIPTPLRLAEG